MAKKELVFDKELIEYHLDIKLKNEKTISLGLDTATTTGYCLATLDGDKVKFDIGYFKVDTTKIKNKTAKRRLIAEHVYKNLEKVIQAPDVVVIEDVFHGLNAHVTILLARIGGIAYAISQMKNIPKIIWKTACEARKGLNLKGNAKKKEIVEIINEIFETNIKNDNIIDAMVLALNGLLEE